jgi:hypothetical protein
MLLLRAFIFFVLMLSFGRGFAAESRFQISVAPSLFSGKFLRTTFEQTNVFQVNRPLGAMLGVDFLGGDTKLSARCAFHNNWEYRIVDYRYCTAGATYYFDSPAVNTTSSLVKRVTTRRFDRYAFAGLSSASFDLLYVGDEERVEKMNSSAFGVQFGAGLDLYISGFDEQALPRGSSWRGLIPFAELSFLMAPIGLSQFSMAQYGGVLTAGIRLRM